MRDNRENPLNVVSDGKKPLRGNLGYHAGKPRDDLEFGLRGGYPALSRKVIPQLLTLCQTIRRGFPAYPAQNRSVKS